MPKLFSNSNKKFLEQVDKSERELNNFICENWNELFPQYIFIKNEFPLKGNVRSLGTNGKMDILAYNPESKKFIIFELKKDYDRNITDQSADYRDYVQDNFSDVYLNSTQIYDVDLPKFKDINQDKVEIILIAKRFSLTQIDRIKKIKDNNITLIKYFWFENDLIFIDYINNDPDDVKIENSNTKKINKIKKIISQEPEIYEIEQYFGNYLESKELFLIFLDLLKSKDNVQLDFKQTKIGIKINNNSFSVIRGGGKEIRKSILQINTEIDVTTMKNFIQIDDRYRGDGKKMKGSLGLERYEVFFRNNEEMNKFWNFIKDKI